jgi:hypothetical protein
MYVLRDYVTRTTRRFAYGDRYVQLTPLTAAGVDLEGNPTDPHARALAGIGRRVPTINTTVPWPTNFGVMRVRVRALGNEPVELRYGETLVIQGIVRKMPDTIILKIGAGFAGPYWIDRAITLAEWRANKHLEVRGDGLGGVYTEEGIPMWGYLESPYATEADFRKRLVISNGDVIDVTGYP